MPLRGCSEAWLWNRVVVLTERQDGLLDDE